MIQNNYIYGTCLAEGDLKVKMWARAGIMNSLGKTFSLTGWKIGWAIAPPHLSWGVRQAHAFLTFATAHPFQCAAAAALRAPDSYYVELKRDYMAKRAILVEGRWLQGIPIQWNLLCGCRSHPFWTGK